LTGAPVQIIAGENAMKKEAPIKHILSKLKREKPHLLETYKVESLGVFGSFARQEQTPSSDLDLLVSFSEPPSLFTFLELEHYLSELLETKVDLVMRDSLKQRIGRRILEDLLPV
jgi:hypothetical protein